MSKEEDLFYRSDFANEDINIEKDINVEETSFSDAADAAFNTSGIFGYISSKAYKDSYIGDVKENRQDVLNAVEDGSLEDFAGYKFSPSERDHILGKARSVREAEAIILQSNRYNRYKEKIDKASLLTQISTVGGAEALQLMAGGGILGTNKQKVESLKHSSKQLKFLRKLVYH